MNGELARLQRSNFQKALNLAVGILGFILPAALYVVSGESDLRGSMSSYYYTDAKWIFVGYLIVLGLLLIVYGGYERKDFWLGFVAGISAWLVAFFPTVEPGVPRDFEGWIHVAATVVLYSILAWFCIKIFTLSKGEKTVKKIWRNRVYKVSGWTIPFSMVMIGLESLIDLSLHDNWTFIFEYLSNTAFGLAWITKADGVFLLNEDPISRWTLREILGYIGFVVLVVVTVFMVNVISSS